MNRKEWDALSTKEQEEIMKKCKESEAYFYNNFFRKSDEPEVSDAEFLAIRESFKSRPIKGRGGQYIRQYPMIKEESFEKWVEIKDGLPAYYECVFAELKTGEVIEVWMATDGEFDVWTKYGTNEAYLSENIVRWKRHRLEFKE